MLFGFLVANAQQDYSEYGKIYRFSSQYSMFPDSLRNAVPRVYQGKTFAAASHYNDSSVLVFVPKHFKKNRSFKMVFYMHGWYNNIDSALQQFKLIEQFYAANTNAILVFPEGPKNSPDSYAGKFEKEGVFNRFLDDLYMKLVDKDILKKRGPTFKMILTGHSGAYRAIAKILSYSRLSIANVFLFDALYGEEEVFADYLKKGSFGKLVCVYTDNGGTKDNCKKFMERLDAGESRYIHKEEQDCSSTDLEFNRVIFLHSNKSHNEVITSYNNFERFLRIPF